MMFFFFFSLMYFLLLSWLKLIAKVNERFERFGVSLVISLHQPTGLKEGHRPSYYLFNMIHFPSSRHRHRRLPCFLPSYVVPLALRDCALGERDVLVVQPCLGEVLIPVKWWAFARAGFWFLPCGFSPGALSLQRAGPFLDSAVDGGALCREKAGRVHHPRSAPQERSGLPSPGGPRLGQGEAQCQYRPVIPRELLRKMMLLVSLAPPWAISLLYRRQNCSEESAERRHCDEVCELRHGGKMLTVIPWLLVFATFLGGRLRVMWQNLNEKWRHACPCTFRCLLKGPNSASHK